MKFLLEFFKSLWKKIIEHSSSDIRIKYLRNLGVRIGQNCVINTILFSTEPYLIEIGDHTAIANNVEFITHDGSVWIYGDEVQGGVFGQIKIGNNVHIGSNCTILYNTTIGDNCIIGTGSVVRGHFPDNSVILGNPAKIVMNTSMLKIIFLQSKGFIRTNKLSVREVDKLVKQHFRIT